ncbi:hypothetical protein, partial [Amycolatopsis pretoriensis]|uniref:hypothetical protein n=1 Tax=Amycolatopsis pretoriensis TaxID=218821 RepID=UPI00146FA8C7
AVGATFGAFGWLFTAFDGGVSGVTWLRVAAAGAGALLTVYLWALFAHRLRQHDHRRDALTALQPRLRPVHAEWSTQPLRPRSGSPCPVR